MKFEVIACLTGILVLILSCKNYKPLNTRGKIQTINATVWSIGLIFWPLLWYKLLGHDLASRKEALVSLMWPIVVIGLDLYLLSTFPNRHRTKKQLLNMDSGTICSLTFAMAGVLSTQFPQNKKCCHSIFMYAIIGCLIFILPITNGSPDSIENIGLEAIQRISLTFSTAFLIAGTLLMKSKPQEITD